MDSLHICYTLHKDLILDKFNWEKCCKVPLWNICKHTAWAPIESGKRMTHTVKAIYIYIFFIYPSGMCWWLFRPYIVDKLTMCIFLSQYIVLHSTAHILYIKHISVTSISMSHWCKEHMALMTYPMTHKRWVYNMDGIYCTYSNSYQKCSVFSTQWILSLELASQNHAVLISGFLSHLISVSTLVP